jgi:N-acetylglucosaminyldiphosphoundecaprenol N-acetyl-beta-D-mannosaminyltransferase
MGILRNMVAERQVGSVVGTKIDAIRTEEAVKKILGWGSLRDSRYVTLCNVHVVVTASRDMEYKKIIDRADISAPDGAPIAWMLRRLGYSNQRRVSGPDLMWKLCERAASINLPIYLYGSTDATQKALAERVLAAFPDIIIAGKEAPPFRKITNSEDSKTIEKINSSGAGIVFVGLGCPKQEIWMAEHRGKIRSVMIGVGAAFDFLSGQKRRAPIWMQKAGMEWFYRLLTEPGRLGKRYIQTNTIFILLVIKGLFKKTVN